MVSGRFSGLCTFGRVQYELCCSYFLACLPHSMAFRGADVKETPCAGTLTGHSSGGLNKQLDKESPGN